MATLTFKPKHVTKRLLGALPERAQTVVIHRYGLGDDPERFTLEAIGKKYGITRERVRQIENSALSHMRKSDIFKQEEPTFQELEEYVHVLGAIVSEDDLLNYISPQPVIQNHIHLLFVLGDSFIKEKENDHFKHRWFVDKTTADRVHGALLKLHDQIGKDDIIPEADIIGMFLKHLNEIDDKHKNEEVLKRWLSLSKRLGRNPLGEWGMALSPNIRVRGMKDYAFLVIRRHGSPMHFGEVAKAIYDVFGKRAHVATTHNELIKDDRFVLVGRGLYALSEWGYEKGVVKDVIHKILKRDGPLVRQEIVDRVLKERYVKENTISVNLQDSRYFGRAKDGRYFAIDR